MKLQDQVCSFEQAKRIYELGVQADALNEWVSVQKDEETEARIHLVSQGIGDRLMGEYERNQAKYILNVYPALSVPELGRALHLDNSGCPPPGLANMSKMGWLCLAEFLPSNNEADTRAKALIHYLETTSITPEEVNRRLSH